MKTVIIAIGNCGFNIASDIVRNDIIHVDNVVLCDTNVSELQRKAKGIHSEIHKLPPFHGESNGYNTSMVSEIVTKDADIIIVCTGLGGKTGSYFAPLVALEAQKQKKKVYSIFTTPLQFEGNDVKNLSEQASMRLQYSSDFFLIQINSSLANCGSLFLGEMNKPLLKMLEKLTAQPIDKWCKMSFGGKINFLPVENEEEDNVNIIMKSWYSGMNVQERITAFNNIGNYQIAEEKIKSQNLVATTKVYRLHEILKMVKFNNLKPLLEKRFDYGLQRKRTNMIEYKDIFEFLLSLTPVEGFHKKMPCKNGECGPIPYLIDNPRLKNWNEFVSLEICVKDSEPHWHFHFVKNLLQDLCDIDKSVYWPYYSYNFISFLPSVDDKGWIKEFVEKKQNGEVNEPLSVLIYLQRHTCLTQEQISSFPSDLLSYILQFPLSSLQEIYHIRSYSDKHNAVMNLKEKIKKYDDSDYSKMRTLLVVFEYSDVKELKLIKFLKRYFKNAQIVSIKSNIEDLRVSRLCVKI